MCLVGVRVMMYVQLVACEVDVGEVEALVFQLSLSRYELVTSNYLFQ